MRITTTCLTLLFFSALPLIAPAYGNVPHAEGATHQTEAVTPADAKTIWQDATDMVQRIETATTSNDFTALHGLTEKLAASLQQLKSATADMPEQRRIRLHGAISQAISATDELHQAADKNDAPLTAEKQARLQSALRLVEALAGQATKP